MHPLGNGKEVLAEAREAVGLHRKVHFCIICITMVVDSFETIELRPRGETYKGNQIGPGIEPWETPHLRSADVDMLNMNSDVSVR